MSHLLLAIGLRRLPMAPLARQAGVSRATLSRRWHGVHEVLGALTTREWTTLALDAMP
ncbi:TetR/AcrR family transcriptional regulator, partial [Streptomyces tateyamensis]